jgi:hypothetical protein
MTEESEVQLEGYNQTVSILKDLEYTIGAEFEVFKQLFIRQQEKDVRDK